MANKIGRPALDLTGQVFGRLKVLYLAQARPLKRRWRCRCSCGSDCVVDQGKLRHGETQSCGCLVHDNALKRIAQHTLPEGEAFINALYSTYTRDAKKKNRPFTLTRHSFEAKITQSCYYCGEPPREPIWAERLRKRKIRWFNKLKAVNGLDRKNNKLGYTPKNTVPCCRKCNNAKHMMSEHEFLTWAHKVVENHNLRT